MAVFRRRRGHPILTVFNEAANGFFSDDAKTQAYYFDDALTLRYVTTDA